MTTNYTDVFGGSTLPPAEYSYKSLSWAGALVSEWPYNSEDETTTIAKITNLVPQDPATLILPDATQVSTGEDFLLNNVGDYPVIIASKGGPNVATIDPGKAVYFYLKDSSTVPGQFGVIQFGVGTSSVDAASLMGFGVKAIGSSLNLAHTVFTTSTGTQLDASYRGNLTVFLGGADTFTVDTAATLGDDWFCMFRNSGTGTATLNPAASETIDGQLTFQVQPGESLMLVCTGGEFYTVGYGRSVQYNFTQLTKDVSAGGTITLTTSEASNKLITFIGNPAAALTVEVPAVVAVYYTYSNISTNQTITLKTSAGLGIGIDQSSRIIAMCDGTDIVTAQSDASNSLVSLDDGNVGSPSLYFATQNNTGLYKVGTTGLGVAVNGAAVGNFGSAGLAHGTIGANNTQRHTVPAVASDTLTLNTATQTLTNKTITLLGNTVSGTKAQFNTAVTDDNFAFLGAKNVFTDIQEVSVNDITVYNGAATDGQVGAGSTIVVKQLGASNTAMAQLVFQARPTFGTSRIVATGGSSPTMRFVNNSVEAISIDSNGLPNLVTGGMGFPATHIPNAGANVLDDYEEGTWTPVVVGSTSAGAGTYSLQEGTYTKVGDVVFFYCSLTWSAHTGTGNIRVNGLPFTVSAGGNTYFPLSTVHSGLAYTSGNMIQSYATNSTTQIVITQATPTGLQAAVSIDTAVGLLSISGSYKA